MLTLNVYVDGGSERNFSNGVYAGQHLTFENFILAESDRADQEVELSGHRIWDQLATWADSLHLLVAVA